AFERFDVVAFRWGEKEEEPETLAAESKRDPEKGIPQARTYQLCIPKVYVASTNKPEDYREFIDHGVGLILIQNSRPKTEIEARVSHLFNKDFYRRSVLPRIKTIQAFYEFMHELLQEYPPEERRKKILNQIDLGVRLDYLWISDRKSNAGIQWSVVCDEEMIRFGINLESVKAATDAFGGKKKEEIEEIFNYIKNLPKDFMIEFKDRGKPPFPGKPYKRFSELEKSRFELKDFGPEEEKFIKAKVMEYKYFYLGVWGVPARGEEIISISKNDLYRRMMEVKENYLKQLYALLNPK
ncbi:MAG: hypothetical protein QXR87_06395, partial [Candidatus Hadarchaeales archaeon]